MFNSMLILLSQAEKQELERRFRKAQLLDHSSSQKESGEIRSRMQSIINLLRDFHSQTITTRAVVSDEPGI